MNAQPTAPPTRRRRRGLKTLALIGLAVVGLSACGGRAFLSMQVPYDGTSEVAEGEVVGAGLNFVHDAPGGKVVSVSGSGLVPWITGGGASAVEVHIDRKADGIHYQGYFDAKLKNGSICRWTILPEAYNVPESGLAGTAVSNCENQASSATWRFDPT